MCVVDGGSSSASEERVGFVSGIEAKGLESKREGAR